MKEEEIKEKIRNIDERARINKINYISALLKCKSRLLKAQKKYQMKLASLDRELNEINKNICKNQGHSYSEWKLDKYTNSYTNQCSICGKIIKSNNKPEECSERILKKKLR